MRIDVTQDGNTLRWTFHPEQSAKRGTGSARPLARNTCVVKLPEHWRAEDCHPDLLGLATILLSWPFTDEDVTLSFAISGALAELYAEIRGRTIGPIDAALAQRTAPGDGRPALAFSGGVDSTAALALMPESTVPVFLDRIYPADTVAGARLYDNDAALYACEGMESFGYEVFRISTDFELIRKPVGFPVDVATGVPAILMADALQFDSIAFGMVMESAYSIGRKGFEDYLSRTHYKHYGRLFEAVGTPFNLTVAGISEVGTSSIVLDTPLGSYSQSCIRGVRNSPCNNCWKCFRKDLLTRALTGEKFTNEVLDRAFSIREARKCLRDFPIKHEDVVTYFCSKHSGSHRVMSSLKQRVRGGELSVDWLRKWYPPSIELIPQQYREGFAKKLSGFLEPMTATEIQTAQEWDTRSMLRSPEMNRRQQEFLAVLDGVPHLPAPSPVSITVLIPSHQRPELLERTLESLAECDLPDGYQTTVVVENGGTFGAEAVCKAADPTLNVTYLHHEEGNKSLALNMALEKIDTGLVLFLDDDVRLSQETLVEYAAAATALPNGWFFGGPIGVDREVEPPEWLERYLPASAKGWAWKEESNVIERPILLGCNWAVRVEDLRWMGGFNQNVGPGAKTLATGQESDMQQRLLNSGLKGWYVDKAMVWHYVPRERSTPEWVLNRAFRNGINRSLRKDYGSKDSRELNWVRPVARTCIEWTKSVLKRDEARKFSARYSYARLKGLIHGRRVGISAYKQTGGIDPIADNQVRIDPCPIEVPVPSGVENVACDPVTPLTVVIAVDGTVDQFVRTIRSLEDCVLPSGFQKTIAVGPGANVDVKRACDAASNSLHVEYWNDSRENRYAAVTPALADQVNGLVVFLQCGESVAPEFLRQYAQAADEFGEKAFFGGPIETRYTVEPPEWLHAFLPGRVKSWTWTGRSSLVPKPVFRDRNWAAFASDLTECVKVIDGVAGNGQFTSSELTRKMQQWMLSVGFQGRYVAAAGVVNHVDEDLCSPDSLLGDAFRLGVDQGHSHRHDLSLRRPPLWLLRPLAGATARTVRAWLSRDDAARFTASLSSQRFRGLIHGLRNSIIHNRLAATMPNLVAVGGTGLAERSRDVAQDDMSIEASRDRSKAA